MPDMPLSISFVARCPDTPQKALARFMFLAANCVTCGSAYAAAPALSGGVLLRRRLGSILPGWNRGRSGCCREYIGVWNGFSDRWRFLILGHLAARLPETICNSDSARTIGDKHCKKASRSAGIPLCYNCNTAAG